MRRILLVVSAVAVVVATGVGCGTKVQNVDPTTEGYITGRWNDSDARAVADELVPECLSAAWLPEFRGQHGDQRPRILIADIENNTSEHINIDVFMNEMERVLINSGQVRFVADPDVRAALMAEGDVEEVTRQGRDVPAPVAQGLSPGVPLPSPSSQ